MPMILIVLINFSKIIMNNSLISIIIPTYNGSKNIKRALTSVLNQTYPNIEIIVVDDASTDNTIEVVNSIKDKRIKLLRHTTNRNGSAARNTGIRASKGEYIAFLDDDDEWLPEKLSRQLEYLESKNPKEWKAVVCGHTMEKSGKVREVFATKEGNLTKEILMMQISMGLGSTLLIQKSATEEVGLFDEKYLRHQDLEFTLRYLRRYKLAAVRECLVKRYGHSGNPSGEKMLAVKKIYLEDFKQDIEQFDKKTVKQIYARQWLQVSKHFALDGDIKNTFKYYFKSLSFAFLFSIYTKILPLENYFTIPYYLLVTLIFGKQKSKR